jgi:prepilin-type N-terminal cleavage/methylation domain-containing protein
MTHPSINPAPNERERHAFTLVEILVVIAIIAILVAITTMVGTAVVNTGKKQATQGILQTLDSALAAYIDAKGENPPALVPVPWSNLAEPIRTQYTSDEFVYYPAIDGRGREGTTGDLNEVNSVALFIESARAVPSTQDIINSINPRYVQNFSADPKVQPFLLTAFDAWGNPIRYVHPKLDGVIQDSDRGLGDNGMFIDIIPDDSTDDSIYFIYGSLPDINLIQIQEVRRNFITADELQNFPNIQTDSDGGLTAGNRPYFYSAGPDGNPATIEDNIYLNPVQHADPGVN